MRRALATGLLAVLILLGAGGPATHALLHTLPGYSHAVAVDRREAPGTDGGSTGSESRGTEDALSPICPLSYLPATRPLPALAPAGPAEVPTTELPTYRDARVSTGTTPLVAYQSRAPPARD